MAELDPADRALLALLHADGRMPLDRMAAATGLSAATEQRRVKRLRDADFALICLARDTADYEQLTRRPFFDDMNVRRFRTSVVMERSKVGLDVGTD